MSKLDITTIILTFNEERHIRRCLENICPISKHVIVVDCYSTDKTVEICRLFDNVEVIQHEWPGNQAEQFNWALETIDIQTEWILRLDADEYLLPGLIDELYQVLPDTAESISALSLSLARAYAGKQLRHGVANSVEIVRIFRRGKAIYEHRLMDEHLQILEGEVIHLKNQFIDDSRISIHQFIEKHNNYASREAFLLLNDEYSLIDDGNNNDTSNNPALSKKRAQKSRYAKMPLFFRAFAYFIYRYIFKLGFLDGKEGFMWDFFQGLWYRMLVDAKVWEVKKACGEDLEKMKDYIRKEFGINL